MIGHNISDGQAKEAAEKLNEYCKQKGCMYCIFAHPEDPETCRLKHEPREYRLETDAEIMRKTIEYATKPNKTIERYKTMLEEIAENVKKEGEAE